MKLAIAMLGFVLTVIFLSHPVLAMAENLSTSENYSSQEGGKISPISSEVIQKNMKHTGHIAEISLFVLSKDGRFAVTADEDKHNYIWDMKNGMLLREIGLPEALRLKVVTAAFSPDSMQLLWARAGKIMPVLWDVESGRRVGVLSSKEKGHGADIVSMTFSADGHYIATGDTQGTVVIWNRNARSVVRRIRAHSGEVRFLAFIPGNNELATAGGDGALRIWGISGDELLATLLEPSQFNVTALTCSKDGQVLYTAQEDMTVKSWTVSSRSLLETLNFNNWQINSLALSPGNDFMALAEENESILLWNIREGKVAWKNDLDYSVTQIFFSHDGNQLFTSGGDNWIREWDVASGHLIKKLGGIHE